MKGSIKQKKKDIKKTQHEKLCLNVSGNFISRWVLNFPHQLKTETL